MYNESITLGTGMTSLPEVSKVLVHEIAHMIDIYALKKTLRKSDPSEEFYRVSWKDPATMKA
jgi:arginine/ornithine N-succinyltransferase beta subunit